MYKMLHLDASYAGVAKTVHALCSDVCGAVITTVSLTDRDIVNFRGKFSALRCKILSDVLITGLGCAADRGGVGKFNRVRLHSQHRVVCHRPWWGHLTGSH